MVGMLRVHACVCVLACMWVCDCEYVYMSVCVPGVWHVCVLGDCVCWVIVCVWDYWHASIAHTSIAMCWDALCVQLLPNASTVILTTNTYM